MAEENTAATIRQATAADEPSVHSLLKEVFDNPAEAHLVDSLRRDGDMALEMVAETDGRIVGHIAYSTVQAPVWALALAPLSVAPTHQKQGIGAALMRSSLRHLKAKNWEAVFVLGDPDYYSRFGFEAAKARTFNSAFNSTNFMALELAPDCLTNQKGEIRHAHAFGKLT